VLEERARAIARPLAEPDAHHAQLDVVVFLLDDEHCAIETGYVRSVAPLGSVTSLPDSPDAFIGLTNLHGEILPVIDLPRSAGGARSRPPARPWIVVLGDERAEFGLAVDRVVEVRTIRADDILAPSRPDEQGWRRGVTKDALIVLDGAALLKDRRLFINIPAQGASPDERDALWQAE
jgi:chemotaxis signal transduction protein